MAKYDLIGVDGNAFSILATVSKWMKKEGCSKEEVDAYLADAKSSNYNHLLCVSMDMVEKLNVRYVEKLREEMGEQHTITEDFAWQVYNIINRWKNGEYGEYPLQTVLDKEL